MQRLHSRFPGGPPGVGLLLLRTAIGVHLLMEGSACLLAPESMSAASWAFCLLAITAGIAFLSGFLTSTTGALLALGGIAFHVWQHDLWQPMPTCGSPVENLLNVNVIVIGAALALLGPGELSLDAHFFGRRKIIIPRANS